jgi:serine protease
LIDIEHAWLLNQAGDDRHQDLPPNIPLIAGFNRQDQRGHGAAVLGVIAALDNDVGVVGIAPQTIIKVISPDQIFPLGVPEMQHVAAMIALAAANLAFGDVLLLEVSSDDLPVELDAFVYEAIRLATAGGVVVVEAGGNGAQNLDSHPFHGESGAIIVGSCVPGIPHSRDPRSNFGEKIDCNAWGDDVFTCGSKTDPVASNAYFNFSGTSAASAIIAGVCLLIQQLRRNKNGAPMHPFALRNVLHDRNNGTEASTFFVDRIGVMPDLGKIIANLPL